MNTIELNNENTYLLELTGRVTENVNTSILVIGNASILPNVEVRANIIIVRGRVHVHGKLIADKIVGDPSIANNPMIVVDGVLQIRDKENYPDKSNLFLDEYITITGAFVDEKSEDEPLNFNRSVNWLIISGFLEGTN